MLSREIKDIKKTKIKVLEMKIAMHEIKNTLADQTWRTIDQWQLYTIKHTERKSGKKNKQHD